MKMFKLAKNKSYRPFILVVVFCIIVNNVCGQKVYALGAIHDQKKYDKIQTISPALRFSDNQFEKYSLKVYCPTPGNQGQIGSCTSWATGYAGATIAQAILENNTNTKEITEKAKSALFIYNQIKEDCPSGAQVEQAISLVEKMGDCDLKDFDPKDCNILPSENEIAKAGNFKFKNHYTLFKSNASNESKIIATINSLNANKPVIISMELMNSFKSVNKKNSKYIPKNGHYGWHALCVIGYDNVKKEFEIINSHGTDFGNNGFFTVSYNDYAQYTLEGFQFTLSNQNRNQSKVLSGDFDILKYIGSNSKQNQFISASPYFSSDNCYHLSESLTKDDIFRIRATNLVKDSYVYILSYKPDATSEILFPTHYSNNQESVDMPYIPASNISIELPIDNDNGYAADQKGDDILCILYSDSKIDSLENKVKNLKNFNGDIWSWLKTSFEENLIDPLDLNYSVNKMGLNTKNRSKGNIAALVLKVNVQ